jgi:membrane-associated phospholipid phosphatase
MSEKRDFLSKNALIMITAIWITTFIIGLLMLVLGYNEEFYVDNSTVQVFFDIITFTGEPIFFIIIIAIFYFVYDKKFAKDLASSLLLSSYIFETAKEIVQDPRPITNADLTDLENEFYPYVEPGYGFPSGHSQNAVAVWGYMAYEFKDKAKPSYLIPTILSVLMFLIAISRVIIGVHDLQDIIGGILIGIIFLTGFIYIQPKVSEKIEPLGLTIKIVLTIIITVALFLIGTIIFPKAGYGLAIGAQPYQDEGAFAQVGGALLGLTLGYLLEKEYVKYNPSDLNIKQKIINLAIGIVILLAIYIGLEFILKGNVIMRFVRYGILSFIVAFIVPLIFTKINK